MDLRPRPQINWRLLSEGDKLHTRRDIPRTVALPGTYNVERLIWRRYAKGAEYLVKWRGYPLKDSTWEPAHHLPRCLLTSYQCPEISDEQLQFAASLLEVSVQSRLRSGTPTVRLNVTLDVYRNVFGDSPQERLVERNDLIKLPLSGSWYYQLNKHGQGVCIKFPIRIQPKLTFQKKWISENGHLVCVRVPREKWIIHSQIGACAITDIL